MPSTARIAILISLLLLPGTLRAQTNGDASRNHLPIEEVDSTPSWAKRLSEPSTGPVQIAPPLAAAGKTPDTAANCDKQAVPLTPINRESRMPLSPSSKTISQDPAKKPNALPSMVTVAGSLGVVLGIFLLIAWLMRRAAPQGLTRLPNEAFEVLGRAPLAGRQNVHLVRCGNKLLLVSVTPAGTETLTEIADPQEVDRLAGLCRQASPRSSTAAFRQIFEQLAPKRPARDEFSPSEYADYYPSGIDLPRAMDLEHRNV